MLLNLISFCPPVGFGQSVARVLEASRISVAWIPVGICQGAIEKTISYVTEREAFGTSLSSNQLVQGRSTRKSGGGCFLQVHRLTSANKYFIHSEKLVRATAMVSSMYLLVERVTWDFIEGNCSLPAISMAKAYNTKLGREVVAICRETLGGNGIVLEHGIAAKFCDMESTYTYEGSYDICSLVAGRALTGVSAIKSGASEKMLSSRRSKL